MIHKLESAGLGYHVKTDESDDRLGMKSLDCYCLTPWCNIQYLSTLLSLYLFTEEPRHTFVCWSEEKVF